MRVLLDESVPRGLKGLLSDHDVTTVQERGWAGIQNGELLRRAAREFEVFVTADRGIEHQQNLLNLELSVVLLVARSNRLSAYMSLVSKLSEAVAAIRPGKLVRVASGP